MNFVRIVDMTGCISMFALIPISVVFLSKKSRLIHKLHKPLTVLCSVMLLLHLLASFMIGSIQDVGFLIVFVSGLLAVAGFVASVIVIVQKKKRTSVGIKLHVFLSLITFVVTVVHITLSGVLL